MNVQQVTGNATFAFAGAGEASGKSDAPAEDFAGLVAQQVDSDDLSPRDKQRRIELERIADVGFVQFQREQHEIKKMMRLLAYFRDKAQPDEQAALGGIIEDLEKNPPRHPQEMYARIEAFIERISPAESNGLKQRMKALYVNIKKWMERPDEELGRLAGI